MPALAEPRKKLFTVEDYYRMAETGILRPDDRVELIEGEIISMSPIGSPHASCVSRLAQLLIMQLNDAANTHIQNPLRLSKYSEPQPDVMLLRFRSNFYCDAHPTPNDVLLLIEVADSSLPFDRIVKLPLYAHHGIPEAWLVNLQDEAVEVHRSPSDDGYRDVSILRGGDTLAPLAFPDCTLTVNAILGKE